MRTMRIHIATPAAPGSRHGNRVTALRWARILREIGHRVRVEVECDGRGCDLLIAVHARRSAPSVQRFRRRNPEGPLVVALAGTDLYRDLGRSRAAARSLALADRLVLLQPLGLEALPRRHRPKARVILQSAPRQRPGARRRERRARRSFDACVLAHLRPVKDPLRAAKAARLLPPASRIRIVHAGGAMSASMEAAARREAAANPRYRWLGEIPRGRALRLLARSCLLVLTSRQEGGANVISEAIGARVPILASRIPGSVGLLGANYPGYFESGDTRGLAVLLARAEADSAFYRRLATRCEALAPRFTPERERRSWAALLRELELEAGGRRTRRGAR